MKYPVFVEPTIRIGEDLKRPDLMAKDQQRLIVMDVIVRYKQGRSLDDAYKEKADKYKNAAEQIAQKLGCNKATVILIVVRSRGAMSDKTKRHLTQLKFSKSDMITISMIVLRSSLEIVNAFVDYDRIE